MSRHIALRVLLILLTGAAGLGGTVVSRAATGPGPAPGAECETPSGYVGFADAAAERVQVTSAGFAPSAALVAGEVGEYFDVDFLEQYAALPPCAYPERMVVEVVRGEFVLDLRLDATGVVALPGGNPVTIMRPITGTSAQPGGFSHYESTGRPVEDPDGRPCLAVCALSAGLPYLLPTGTRVSLPGAGVCLWCLLNGSLGQLRVYAEHPVGDAVSLTLLKFDANATLPPTVRPASATATATASASISGGQRLGWALNPGTNCRGG